MHCKEDVGAPPTGNRAVGPSAPLETGQPSQSSRRRWQAFALLVVAYFMTIVDITIVNVALPTIGRQLHFSESALQWVPVSAALTGGFRVAVSVCGLAGLTAVPLAFMIIRRVKNSRPVSNPETSPARLSTHRPSELALDAEASAAGDDVPSWPSALVEERFLAVGGAGSTSALWS